MLRPGLVLVGEQRQLHPPSHTHTPSSVTARGEVPTALPSLPSLLPNVEVVLGISDGLRAGHHRSGDTSEGLGCELQEGMLGWRWISNSEHWLHN